MNGCEECQKESRFKAKDPSSEKSSAVGEGVGAVRPSFVLHARANRSIIPPLYIGKSCISIGF